MYTLEKYNDITLIRSYHQLENFLQLKFFHKNSQQKYCKTRVKLKFDFKNSYEYFALPRYERIAKIFIYCSNTR